MEVEIALSGWALRVARAITPAIHPEGRVLPSILLNGQMLRNSKYFVHPKSLKIQIYEFSRSIRSSN